MAHSNYEVVSCRGQREGYKASLLGVVLQKEGGCSLSMSLGFGGGSTGEILLQNQKFFLSLRTRKPLEGS